MKAAQLSDASIDELSLVFRQKDGAEWQPRNPEARVLAVKGAEKKNLVAKAMDALKAYFADDEETVEPSGYPVSEAADNIDNDGDGPEDYNAIVFAVCSLYSDLTNAWNIGDESARSAAIVACIDAFIGGLDKLRSGSEKAGARHSEGDLEHLRAIADAQVGIGEHIAAIEGALKNLGITGAAGTTEGKQGDEQDSGPENSQVDDDADKAQEVPAVAAEITPEEIQAMIAGSLAK